MKWKCYECDEHQPCSLKVKGYGFVPPKACPWNYSMSSDRWELNLMKPKWVEVTK